MSCSPVLETCQLDDIKATVAGMLGDLGDIQRQALVDDLRGGLKPSDAAIPWPVVHGGQACRVDPMRVPNAHAIDYRLTVDGGYDISFLAGADIRNKDRVRVTTLGNRVFKIIGPRYASDEILRVMAAEEFV